ncbi:hypothetical protein GCM10010381_14420 [Streptomyces xantholiticus]|nr:hypothetical protein GCM10010381_14420 [Streptomyces xantholiticus]
MATGVTYDAEGVAVPPVAVTEDVQNVEFAAHAERVEFVHAGIQASRFRNRRFPGEAPLPDAVLEFPGRCGGRTPQGGRPSGVTARERVPRMSPDPLLPPTPMRSVGSPTRRIGPVPRVGIRATIRADIRYGTLGKGVFTFRPGPAVLQVTVWALYPVPALGPFPAPVGFGRSMGVEEQKATDEKAGSDDDGARGVGGAVADGERVRDGARGAGGRPLGDEG